LGSCKNGTTFLAIGLKVKNKGCINTNTESWLKQTNKQTNKQTQNATIRKKDRKISGHAAWMLKTTDTTNRWVNKGGHAAPLPLSSPDKARNPHPRINMDLKKIKISQLAHLCLFTTQNWITRKTWRTT